MKLHFCRFAVLAVAALTTVHLAAQKGGLDPSFSTAGGVPVSNDSGAGQQQTVVTKGTVLVLNVHNDNGLPFDSQALVQVISKTDQSVRAQVTQDKALASFVDLQAGVYDVTVSALGYLTLHQEFVASGRPTTSQMVVTLKKDPSAIDLSAVKTQEMPGKIRKDLLLGSAALRTGRLDEAQKRLESASRKDPSNADVNFLFGYLYFEKHDPEKAQGYLLEATKAAPHNVQALTLLGRVELQRDDYAAAGGPLKQAVAVDPDSWMARYLLATVYLHEKEFEKAADQAQFAIERGRQQANAAQLTLGQAFASLKKYPQALDALQTFLRVAPTDANAGQVRQLVAEIEKRQTQMSSSDQDQPMSTVTVHEPLVAATQPEITLKGWGPVAVDVAKPQVAAGVSCPAEDVIAKAGERVKDLVDDLAKFDAIEDVYHEDVDQAGVPKKQVTLKFDYVASISEPKPGRFLVDEYRSGRSGTEDFPDQIATRGLPTLAFIFHPDMRDDFDMACEGLGTWNQKATWLVHFRQREDKPHRIQDYVINGKVYPVSMKGRAWISADTYQIVRLESELVTPMPEIQLMSEHQTVDYAPVQFPKSKTELWLPKNAEIYFDFRKHRYFRRHSFDHFMLFSVDMEEKRKEPKQAEKGPESRTPKTKHRKVPA
jgi:tetratricopeptide (TPR) repeat protein